MKYGWVSSKFLRVTSSGGSSLSGGSCDTEYQTGAEVCLEVTSADLDCRESYSGDYYRSCDTEISYELQTDYRGQSSINVDVQCEAEISYKARQSYRSSDTDYSSDSHSLYAHGSDYGTAYLSFSFSSYKEVYKVELDSARCEIQSIDLW